MASKISGWTLGVILIGIVALIWNFASILVQVVFVKFEFNKPFFLTYIANSAFLVLLPGRAVVAAMNPSLFEEGRDEQETQAEGEELQPPHNARGVRGLRATAWASLCVCPIWFAANVLYNFGLGLTTIVASTVIAASSTAFTLILSFFVLGERVTLLKVVGVALCMGGNILTAFDSSNAGDDGGHEKLLGDVLSLAGAVMYAVYTIAICYFAPQDMTLFFGLLGTFNCILLGPVVLALHFTGLESLSALTWQILGLLVAKGLLDNVLSDTIWGKAMLLTSANVATVGLSLTVPLAFISQLLLPKDWMVDTPPPSWYTGGGALLVLAGFCVISATGHSQSKIDPVSEMPLKTDTA